MIFDDSIFLDDRKFSRWSIPFDHVDHVDSTNAESKTKGFEADERSDIGVNIPLSILSIIPNSIWDADIFILPLWLELRVLSTNVGDFL